MFSNELKTIAAALKNKGGTPYLVGGAVRDLILEKTPKDFDLEVFNLPGEDLIEVLKKFGKVSQVGKSFGVYLLKTKNQTYDVSLPRRERKIADGHKGFQIESDPAMTPKEAASRRDFTINAMMYDFSENIILDFFNGQEDLDKLFILTVMYSNNCDLGTRSKQDIDNGRKMIVLYCMVYPDFILVIA